MGVLTPQISKVKGHVVFGSVSQTPEDEFVWETVMSKLSLSSPRPLSACVVLGMEPNPIRVFWI